MNAITRNSMETKKASCDELGNVTASVIHSIDGYEQHSCCLSSEPLQKYMAEFKEELRAEMSKISEIKW